jgi:4-hydroxybenzoate polyprenyltransferase/phosphoglycolate phosphatase-like HAD superfamily hydrolase
LKNSPVRPANAGAGDSAGPHHADMSADRTALVIDLDGTLVRTDMLYESYFAAATSGFNHHVSAIEALRRGKAQLKAYLAEVAAVDHGLLPYNQAIVDLAREARAKGRPVYLATASNRRHAEAVASHLGIFDGVFASDETVNLSGETKALELVRAFGEGRFDYVGNSHADLAVWARARKCYVAGDSPGLIRKAADRDVVLHRIEAPGTSPRLWLRALRVHQYSKNVLVFVPMLTAHAYGLPFVIRAMLAFVAFSLCASSVYLLNDLIDLNADRQHPTKRNRPFASGAIPLSHGVAAIPLLLVLAFACGFAVSIPFVIALSGYFLLTLAYSLTLKRRLIVDIVVLAALYTIRVIAGAAALPVIPSEWLLAFSMCIFACLALVKRYIELTMRIDRDLPDPANRNYRLIDLPIVGALAAASGFNAVTIFALYISSAALKDLYRHEQLLWLICPILLYWLSRLVILAHRRVIDDDPIVFALRDRNSRICAGCMIAVVLLAS